MDEEFDTNTAQSGIEISQSLVFNSLFSGSAQIFNSPVFVDDIASQSNCALTDVSESTFRENNETSNNSKLVPSETESGAEIAHSVPSASFNQPGVTQMDFRVEPCSQPVINNQFSGHQLCNDVNNKGGEQDDEFFSEPLTTSSITLPKLLLEMPPLSPPSLDTSYYSNIRTYKRRRKVRTKKFATPVAQQIIIPNIPKENINSFLDHVSALLPGHSLERLNSNTVTTNSLTSDSTGLAENNESDSGLDYFVVGEDYPVVGVCTNEDQSPCSINSIDIKLEVLEEEDSMCENSDVKPVINQVNMNIPLRENSGMKTDGFYSCRKCNFFSNKKEEFIIHCVIKHSMRYVCVGCFMAYKEENELIAHYNDGNCSADPAEIANTEELLEEGAHVCGTCKQSFHSEIMLATHYLKGTCMPERRKGKELYQQNVRLGNHKSHKRCSNEAKNRQDGIRNSRRQRYVCDKCDTSTCFSTLNAFIDHTVEHHHSDSYVCEICAEDAKSEDNLLEHYNKCHKPTIYGRYECEICFQYFISLNHLEIHKSVHRKHVKVSEDSRESFKNQEVPCPQEDMLVLFPCGLCKETLSSQEKLEDHKLKYHTRKFRISSKKPWFNCPLCKTVFSSEVEVNAHYYMYHIKKTSKSKVSYNFGCGEDSRYFCGPCKKSFISFERLNKHNKKRHSNVASLNTNVTEECLSLYRCTTCSKVFNSTAKLEKHKRKHDNSEESASNKNFICSLCKVVCLTLPQLEFHHLKTHSNLKDSEQETHKKVKSNRKRIKTYEPPVFIAQTTLPKSQKSKSDFLCEKCNKQFLNKETYDSHVSLHVGDSSLLWCECGVPLTCESYLERHRAMHKTASEYKCFDCNLYFKSKTLLTSHYKLSAKCGFRRSRISTRGNPNPNSTSRTSDDVEMLYSV